MSRDILNPIHHAVKLASASVDPRYGDGLGGRSGTGLQPVFPVLREHPDDAAAYRGARVENPCHFFTAESVTRARLALPRDLAFFAEPEFPLPQKTSDYLALAFGMEIGRCLCTVAC